jgi:hypothetical protein
MTGSLCEPLMVWPQEVRIGRGSGWMWVTMWVLDDIWVGWPV